MLVKLFDEMFEEGIEFNVVIFFGVLLVCVYGGFVDKFWLYFRQMYEYKIVFELKYYVSMADCMVRVGFLEEVEKFMEEMFVEVDEVVMGVVLSGCKVYGNV